MYIYIYIYIYIYDLFILVTINLSFKRLLRLHFCFSLSYGDTFYITIHKSFESPHAQYFSGYGTYAL